MPAVAFYTVVNSISAHTNSETFRQFLSTEYKMKMAPDQESSNAQMMKLIIGNKALNTWSIVSTNVSMKGFKNML